MSTIDVQAKFALEWQPPIGVATTDWSEHPHMTSHLKILITWH